jgi:hypothetical protein
MLVFVDVFIDGMCFYSIGYTEKTRPHPQPFSRREKGEYGAQASRPPFVFIIH